MKNILLVFAKYPAKGEVKTRLGAEIGHDNALKLYTSFVSHIINTMKNHIDVDEIWCAVSPKNKVEAFSSQFKGATSYFAQNADASLGTRLRDGISQLLQRGDNKVVAIGTDSPNMPAENITAAFKKLDRHDFVLGPALDGGYYLIGQSQIVESVFNDIEWSSEKVLQQSISKIKNAGCTYALLPPFYDIDTAQNLKQLMVDAPDLLNSITGTEELFQSLRDDS